MYYYYHHYHNIVYAFLSIFTKTTILTKNQNVRLKFTKQISIQNQIRSRYDRPTGLFQNCPPIATPRRTAPDLITNKTIFVAVYVNTFSKTCDQRTSMILYCVWLHREKPYRITVIETESNDTQKSYLFDPDCA